MTETNGSMRARGWLTVAACSGVLGLAAYGDVAAQEVKPKAKLHLDYASHRADVKPMSDGFALRRAEVGIEGTLNPNWEFELGYDLTNDGRLRPSAGKFKDVNLEYSGWRVANVTFGQQKLPFGLEDRTSSNATLLMERALPVDAFAPSRRMGVALNRNRNNYTLAAMVFGASIGGDDRGRGMAARVTVTPLRTERALVHLGISAVTESPHGQVKFGVRPESRVADVKLVNTGTIADVDRIDSLGLEAGWQSGSVSAQAEWMQVNLARRAGQPDLHFNGSYVAASWVITGESRRYKQGAFKGITPERASGAWELAARVSQVQLDDDVVRGGRQRDVSIGVNYYANKHLRIMANYIKVHSTRRGSNDNPDLFQIRAQLVY